MRIFLDSILNYLSRAEIYLVVEGSGWVISEEAKYIRKELEKSFKVRVTESPFGIFNSIVHFLSMNTLINNTGMKPVSRSNKIILSWLHVVSSDPRNDFGAQVSSSVDTIHTICTKTKLDLVSLGVPKEKIEIIPQGLDFELFRPYSSKNINELKKTLGLPIDMNIIGSFQKDGVGWGDGNEPKLIKGPDIFCDTLIELKKTIDFHVLLTGPARGYVKSRLDSEKIPYTHIYFNDYKKIVDCYNCIDLYLCTSRVEGGPKAILESWRTKTPIVISQVGMALDIVKNNENGILTQIGNVSEIVEGCLKVIKDIDVQKKMIEQGFEDSKNYSWERAVEKYIQKLYHVQEVSK